MPRGVIRTITVPACGMVKGGRLDGWRFHFICFQVDGMRLEIIARCTPPAWPFFREIGMNHTHFATLRPVVGDRAKRLNASPLIATAYRVQGIEPPKWLLESDMTLRARIKRTHGGINHGRPAPCA